MPEIPRQPTVTLTFMVPQSMYSLWESLSEDFEAENREISIELKPGPNVSNELEEEYVSRLENDSVSPVDLVYMDIIWVPRFAEEGWVKNLSAKDSQEIFTGLKTFIERDIKDFLNKDVTGGYYKENLYRIPLVSDVGVFYYRKDLLDAVNRQPPKTLDDLKQITRNLSESDGFSGYIWPSGQYEGAVATFVEILDSNGGFWIDSDNRVGLDEKESVEVVKFLRGLIEEKLSPGEFLSNQKEETLEQFQDGEAIFLRSWVNVWKQLNTDTESNVRGQVRMEKVPGIGKPSRGCQGGWGMGIASTTQHPKEAWAAIKFFTSPIAQYRLAKEGYVPSRKKLLSDQLLVKKFPYYPVLQESLENSILRPSIPQYYKASGILQNYLYRALEGSLEAEKAMEEAAHETRELLKNA